jgi:hypothetical protein
MKLSLRDSLKMIEKPTIYQLLESEEFSLAATRIGDPQEVDAALEELLHKIACKPQSFPVVVWPNERMAALEIRGSSIGVFFRIIHNSLQVELLRSLVKN